MAEVKDVRLGNRMKEHPKNICLLFISLKG